LLVPISYQVWYPQTNFALHVGKGTTMAGRRKTFDIGRDSRTGQFIPVKQAEKRPNTTTVERVPKRGYGDTKNEPRRNK